MINTHKLELPLSRTNFHGPKDVRAIENSTVCNYVKLGGVTGNLIKMRKSVLYVYCFSISVEKK